MATKEQRDSARAKAVTMWATFDKNQKTAVRFGMFPADKMAEAEAAGFDGHEVCIGLMDCAAHDGGMRA